MKLALNTRDLINIAIFSVIYFVIMYGLGMLGFFGPHFMFVAWSLSILLNGIVVMLLLARVPKIGSLTLLGFLVGLGMAPGHTIWILIGAPVLGFICDLIAFGGQNGKRLQPKRAILAYAVLQLWFLIPLIPMMVDADSYYADIAQVMGAEYTQAMRALFSPTVLSIWAVALLVLGLIGGWIGVKAGRRHFQRAGLTK